ncbi:hypothetical protein BT93_C1557 [Corymbia citriodora subsp. variegata]|nr:hypothetical protein BT93_C1557 [Corymbia citriodora subsp. variegata]
MVTHSHGASFPLETLKPNILLSCEASRRIGMSSDSEDSGYEVPVHMTGLAVAEPINESPKQLGVRGGRSASSYEWTSRAWDQDRKTGDYARATTKQTFSSGDTFKERSTGRVGYKDELKETTTVRVGNKSGYSEYQVQERLRTVKYGEGSSGRNSKGYNNNSLTHKKY